MSAAIQCCRRTLPYGIAYWSSDERYVYLVVDDKPHQIGNQRLVNGDAVPFLVTYHDADQTDCEITVDGVSYRFQV